MGREDRPRHDEKLHRNDRIFCYLPITHQQVRGLLTLAYAGEANRSNSLESGLSGLDKTRKSENSRQG
jgi:uncharacterized protein (DUF924 family)